MRYSVKTGSPEKISADCIVIAIWNKGALSDEAKKLMLSPERQSARSCNPEISPASWAKHN